MAKESVESLHQLHKSYLLQVISKKLPSDQLKPFIELIEEGLLDPQSHSSSGACVVLNGIMKNRGTELIKEV